MSVVANYWTALASTLHGVLQGLIIASSNDTPSVKRLKTVAGQRSQTRLNCQLYAIFLSDMIIWYIQSVG